MIDNFFEFVLASYYDILVKQESTTNLIFSIVRLVSAILELTITLRLPYGAGSKTLIYYYIGSAP